MLIPHQLSYQHGYEACGGFIQLDCILHSKTWMTLKLPYFGEGDAKICKELRPNWYKKKPPESPNDTILPPLSHPTLTVSALIAAAFIIIIAEVIIAPGGLCT